MSEYSVYPRAEVPSIGRCVDESGGGRLLAPLDRSVAGGQPQSRLVHLQLGQLGPRELVAGAVDQLVAAAGDREPTRMCCREYRHKAVLSSPATPQSPM